MYFVLFAAALSGAPYAVTPIDDGARIVLENRQPPGDATKARCRWIVYRDGLPYANGSWALRDFAPGCALTNAAPEVLGTLQEDPCDLALRVRFVTGDEDVDKETLLAIDQVDYPRNARALPQYVGEPAELSETPGFYEFKTPATRIRFDRSTGLLAGFATGWWSLTEWMGSPLSFDFGEDAPRIRLEEFTAPSQTNGVWTFRTISWWEYPASAEKPRNFEIRVATDWTVRGDGRVCLESSIRPFGERLELPRLGWATVLTPKDPLIQYHGAGEAAQPKGQPPRVLTGLYTTSVANCGRPTQVRAIAFDAEHNYLSFATLGDDFNLEIARTRSGATFCGIAAARQLVADQDWQIKLLISPEKVLRAYK